MLTRLAFVLEDPSSSNRGTFRSITRSGEVVIEPVVVPEGSTPLMTAYQLFSEALGQDLPEGRITADPALGIYRWARVGG